jgi:hypothetical protein
MCTFLRLAAVAIALAGLPAHAQDLSGEVKNMSWIGFQQFQESSRVFVRTTEKASYRVDNSRRDTIVLILENTRVELKNNTRFLDTRYFDGPVAFIQPKVIEGTSPSVRIEIRLRERVPFREVQNDNFLALDFARS